MSQAEDQFQDEDQDGLVREKIGWVSYKQNPLRNLESGRGDEWIEIEFSKESKTALSLMER